MKYLIFALLLTGCSSQYATKQDLIDIAQKIDQNFQNQGGKIQILIEKLYPKELAKGRAANCPNGFDFRTGECLEAAKK